jgi:transcriptional regulator with XRE-family HTH domain
VPAMTALLMLVGCQARSSEGNQQRQQRKLTQGELGKLLRSSQSRIAKMEAGDPSVSLDLLMRSLLALGTSREDLAHMIAPQEPTTAT